MRLSCLSSAFLLSALLLAPALPARAAAPTAPAAEHYVALGDSYSSGLGAGHYAGGGCRRSDRAFPVLVARARPRMRLSFAACAGAVTADVERQLAALTPATTHVTVTAGGNDAGFTDVVARCALPGWAADCAARVRAATAFVRTQLPPRLDRLFAAIRARAPRARVAAIGYPRLFGAEDCDLLTWFDGAERAILNGAADLLSSTIAARAAASAVGFVDTAPAFAAHPICSAGEWLHGVAVPLAASFHPNELGHRLGLAPLVRAILC